MLHRALIPILTFALAASAAAQSDNPAPADESVPALEFDGLIEVSEVLLDVLATDVNGVAVAGLDKDDFIVEENGEPVRLTDVSFYTTRYGYGDGVEEIPSSRYFVLFFHHQWQKSYRNGHLKEQQLLAGYEARRWLQKELLPSDWVAVVGYESELRLYQDFTQDRDLLKKAVKRAAVDGAPAKAKPRRHSREVGVFSRLPRGKELRRDTETVYGALEAVAEACAYLAGRKNLLMFTMGFGKPQRFGQAEADPDFYPRLEATLNDHNIAVYPIDLSPAGRVTQQDQFLTRLAADTGGTYHRDFEYFVRPLRDIGGDNYAYYVLSYQSGHPAGETGYQRIEVRAKDEGVYVRSRGGYRYGL